MCSNSLLVVFQLCLRDRPRVEGPPEGVVQVVHRSNGPDDKVATAQLEAGAAVRFHHVANSLGHDLIDFPFKLPN